MTRRRLLWVAAVVIVIAAGVAIARAGSVLPTSTVQVPTAKVIRGPLKLTVYANGELRAGQTMTLSAPRAGGQLRIVKLLPTGTRVQKGDVVLEFDPADQQYQLEQEQSDYAAAQQEIVKLKADTAVQNAQDQVDLLTAQYDVRRGELNVLGNEFVGAIDAKKNELSLEEARRHLEQLQQDIKARAVTSAAAMAVQEEKANKARLAMERAQSIIDSLVIRSPIDGIVSVKENRDATGGMIFFGMIIPEYRQGDTASSGRPIADVIESGRMQIRAKILETDRGNLQTGQPATVQIDAMPGRTFTAKVGALSTLASRGSFFETTSVRQFDVVFELEHPDPQMRAGSSVHLVIDGREIPDALHVPRQAVFDKNGRNFVYLKKGNRFESHDVKVTNLTESRAIVSGLGEGDEIALVDPETALRRTSSSPTAPVAGVAGGTPQ
jgi:multidrug efflux pump subunit AcrA (membrane-fusion protein)